MPYLEIAGTTLHYRERGEGEPVVLLSSYPLTGESFAPQLEALSDRWRVIAPDYRGFGGSAPLEGPLTMERLARDVIALLDALALPHAVVGGVSMGGYVTMALLREDPSRVRGILLMDTQAVADDEQGRAGREAIAQAALTRGIDAVVEIMLPKLLRPTSSDEVRHQVEAMIRQNRPDACAAAMRGMATRPDGREILARFGGPSLVVCGEEDRTTPLERAQQMADLLSTRVVRIPSAGHLAHLEQPQLVNAALRGFLEKLG